MLEFLGRSNVNSIEVTRTGLKTKNSRENTCTENEVSPRLISVHPNNKSRLRIISTGVKGCEVDYSSTLPPYLHKILYFILAYFPGVARVFIYPNLIAIFQ
jgi:hypothetical protein